MISEEQQDQAALHALGLLPADEAEALERAMDADADLRALIHGLREAAAAVALGAPAVVPSPGLRARVLGEIGVENATAKTAGAKVVPFRLPAWVPWGIAAALLATCVILGTELAHMAQDTLAQSSQLVGPLAQLSLFALSPGEQAPPSARGVVAWEPLRQRGILSLTGLPKPDLDKDYQLWAILAGDKGPVSVGVVTVEANGTARVEFRPNGKVAEVAAFAISLERAGGSPDKPAGPILLAPGG